MNQQTSKEYNKDNKLYGLDHLRAFAITFVFLYHYRIFSHPAWVDTIGSFGWTGVDLFFVLSGFLIASQLFRQLKSQGSIDIWAFFVKRFFRIIPPYLLVVAIYFCIPAFREREALPPLWKFLSFTQNFGMDLMHKGTFSHAWSLCIEEQFYLALPFLILLLGALSLFRYGKYLIIFLLILVIVLRLLSWNHFIQPVLDKDNFWLEWYKWIYYPTYTRLDGLLTGVGLAAIMEYNNGIKKIIHKNGNWFFTGGLLLLIPAYFICEDQGAFWATIIGFTIVAFGYGCFVAAAASQSSFLYKTKSFITAQVAGMSYVIYLSHKGIIHLTQEIMQKTGYAKDSNLTMVACIVACILVALLIRYVVEQPSAYLRNRVLATIRR